jgi:hypothetical protein
MEDHEIDTYINEQLGRIFGFKRGLAELIYKFGMDDFIGIEAQVLAEYLYDQMSVAQQYRRRFSNGVNQS